MKIKAIIFVSLATIAFTISSCQGRRADATPTGETVEVTVESTVSEQDAYLPSDTIMEANQADTVSE